MVIFVDGFMWGCATSAYQVEGGWDSDGKGENNWDRWSHENNGSNIRDGKNGDIGMNLRLSFIIKFIVPYKLQLVIHTTNIWRMLVFLKKWG